VQVATERVLGRQTTLALTVMTSGAKDRPVALLLHGAQRNRSVMVEVGKVLNQEFDVALCDLPGHGESETPIDVSVDDYALEMVHLLLLRFPGRPVMLVGESIGGVIALRAAADARLDVRWLVLCDPPLTTAKQWHIRFNSLSAMSRDPSVFRRLFSAAMFGVYDQDRQEERLYYDLLADIRAPCLILTGDLPLNPQRASAKAMCCLDEADLWVIQKLYGDKVVVARVRGAGHTVLTHQPQACLQTIGHFLQSHPLAKAAA
jgi:pimeloyl-ACP methyl ester carboxylesterase